MPALANATDIARGVVRVPINRSQPPIGGEPGSAAGLGGAGLKREDKRPMHSGQRDSGQRRAHRYCQWLDCRHHAPTSIAPSPMVVTDCRAGSSTRPSEAACAFHLLATPINRSSRWESSTMVTSEPHAVRQRTPTPIFRWVWSQPVGDDLRKPKGRKT